jgi:hypothetical protein
MPHDEREENAMNVRWRKRMLKLVVLGLAAAAVGASDPAIHAATSIRGNTPVNDYGPGTAHPDFTPGPAPEAEPYDYGPGTAHPTYVPFR